MAKLAMHEEKMEPKTNQPNNMPKNSNIDNIVKELQRMVGFRKVVLWPEVPPGASLWET